MSATRLASLVVILVAMIAGQDLADHGELIAIPYIQRE